MNDEKENGKNSNSNHALAFQKENYSFIVQLWSLWIIVFIHFYRFSINLISFDLILYAFSVFFRFLLKNLNTHIFCTTWIINTVLLVGSFSKRVHTHAHAYRFSSITAIHQFQSIEHISNRSCICDDHSIKGIMCLSLSSFISAVDCIILFLLFLFLWLFYVYWFWPIVNSIEVIV